MASTIHLAAVAVALALLGGGALAAAHMGVNPAYDNSHPVAPMGGHGQAHDGKYTGAWNGPTGVQEKHGYSVGMEHKDRSMNREECRRGNGQVGPANITSINATIVSVDAENRTIEVSTGENETLTLWIKSTYTDTSNGYLVSGSWLALQLETGATVTVMVPANATAFAPLLGIEIDGTLYVAPGLEPIVVGG